MGAHNAQLDLGDRIVAIDSVPLTDQISYERAMVEAGSRCPPLAQVCYFSPGWSVPATAVTAN